MKQRSLIACGITAPLLYLGGLVIGRAAYPGYHPLYQSVSELIAAGAPTRPVLAGLFFACAVMLIFFGLGIYRSARQTIAALERMAAGLGALILVTISLLGILLLVFPMDPPESAAALADYSLTGKLHVALACIMSAASLPAVLLVGWWMNGHENYRGMARYSFFSGALLFIAGSTTAVIYFSGFFLLGAFQRLTFALFFQWVMAAGGFLLRAECEKKTSALDSKGLSTDRREGELLKHSNPALM